MTHRRLLYAPNIHQGGGRVLLLPLLILLKDSRDVVFVLDRRLNLPDGIKLLGIVHWVNPTLYSRLKIERLLRNIVTLETTLLCMGNLPPLFVHKGNQKVFIQNRYLIDNISLSSFPLVVHIRLMIERWWLRSRVDYVSTFIVQTHTMQQLMKNFLDVNAIILPYAVIVADDEKHLSSNKMKYDFLYVASGEPHKNHKILVKSWVKLAERGCFPSLCLTLDRNNAPDLCTWIAEKITEHELNISLVGECPHGDVQKLYAHSRALIYPSLFESFGLPLIEAVSVGLPILASDASYVTDVIEPTDVFDPNSAEEIANAVQGFCHNPSSLKLHLYDTNEFLSRVFSEDAA